MGRRARTQKEIENWLNQLGPIVIEQSDARRKVRIANVWIKIKGQNQTKPAEIYTDHMWATPDQVDKDLKAALFNYLVNHLKSGHPILGKEPINPKILEM